MWDAIHLWSGIGMIIAMVIHIAVHDRWILAMSKRFFHGKSEGIKSLNGKARFNIFLDVIAALSFLVVAILGVVLLVLPSGRSVEVVDGFLLSKVTWDIIHTWSGVVMLIAAILHFYTHWKWITKVTRRVIGKKKTIISAKEK